MPKQPRITAAEAEKMLLKADFELIRSKGSHRIYQKFVGQVANLSLICVGQVANLSYKSGSK